MCLDQWRKRDQHGCGQDVLNHWRKRLEYYKSKKMSTTLALAPRKPQEQMGCTP